MTQPVPSARALVVARAPVLRIRWSRRPSRPSLAPAAFAQSTGSIATEEELTEVVVSARRTTNLGTVTRNRMRPRPASRSRPRYLESQQAGQAVIANLNQVPGVNFTNNDAYGNSGGNLRLRGSKARASP